MKIAVLLKQVPDTETRIRIKGDASGIEEADIKYIISPYCEFAVEEAIRLKEKSGATETVAISLGAEKAVEAIRTALAMGIDKGIHIDSEGKILDNFMTATIIANAIKDRGFDVILCGKQAIDDDSSQVSQMVAEILDIPQVMILEKLEINADKKGAVATRRITGGGKEIYDIAFPALFGCEKGLNTPRYASLPGIMKAKTKPVEKLKGSDLLGGATALTNFVNYQLPPEKQAGKKIEGDPAVQAATLAKLLREEAKII